ncbi:MAG: preprotein translocase subunit SecG [bacterium]
MDWKKVITVAQVVVAILVVISILLQNRGEGMGTFLGGGGEVFRSRRGFEKVLYYLTIVLSVLLVALSIANTAIT